jgi:uncharacterized protein (TIGR03435 family)
MWRGVTVAIICAAALSAQKFEVASIKPTIQTPEEAFNSGRLGIRVNGTRVEIGGALLNFLIATAYRTEVSRVSGPSYLTGQAFDIQANMPEGSTKEQMPDMLKALLVERFKLQAHHEQKEQPVYALEVGPEGAKLRESAPDAGTSGKPFPNGAGGRRLLQTLKGADGIATISSLNGETLLEAEKISMADLAKDLIRYAELPIVDMTGLKGTYQVAMNVPLRGARAAADPNDVSIFASIQKLGLRLEKRKVPLDFIVVDHVEKSPTGN